MSGTDSPAKTDRNFKVFLALKKLGKDHGLSEPVAQRFAQAAVRLFVQESRRIG